MPDDLKSALIGLINKSPAGQILNRTGEQGAMLQSLMNKFRRPTQPRGILPQDGNPSLEPQPQPGLLQILLNKAKRSLPDSLKY